MDQEPVFALEKIYALDIKTDVHGFPDVYLRQDPLMVDVNLNASSQELAQDGYYACHLNVHVHGRHEQTPAFDIRFVQGGVFELRYIHQEDMETLLNVTCPEMLFPYARELVTDLSLRAGFTPILLEPTNFVQLRASLHSVGSSYT